MNRITEYLQGDVKCVAIAGHIRPDGDCIGAVLGLYHYLRRIRPEISVDPYLQTVPERFAGLPGTEQISTSFDTSETYDVFFSVDCGDLERLGPAGDIFKAAKRTVCIDHHISNRGFADENVIGAEISSTCEILYSMMEDAKVNLDAAVCLYLGMAHDTGVFQYANTSPETMRLAARLLERGFDHTKLIDETFYEKTYVQTQVLGRALMESILIFDKRCAVSVIKHREMEFYGIGPDGMEGIVSQLQLIRGVSLSIFLYEIEPMKFRVSMRSDGKVDVSLVAALFGGGGHRRAAGCTVEGGYHDVLNSLTLHIQDQMDQEQNG